MGNQCFSAPSASTRNKTSTSASLLAYKKVGTLARNAPSFMPRKSANLRPIKSILRSTQSMRKVSVSVLQQHPRCSIIQDYIVVWLTADPGGSVETVRYLRDTFCSVRMFTDVDEFFAFMVHMAHERLFLILSAAFATKDLSFIERTPQLVAIFIMSDAQSKDEPGIQQCGKVQGVFTTIEPVCKSIQSSLQSPENETMPYQVLSSATTIVQWLTTKLLLHEIDYASQSLSQFVDVARRQYPHELNIVDEFANSYTPSKAIWWYTRKCFLHHALNQAFRTENFHQLILMGFFMRDLHQQITRAREDTTPSTPKIVYRGQGILDNDVIRMQKTTNGVFVFKNFLWTTTDENLSFSLAQSASQTYHLCGAVFRIEVSASVALVSLEKWSYYLAEKNTFLLSMDCVFRLRSIRRLENQLWQVDLVAIDHIDPQLKSDLEHLDTSEGDAAWQKLGFYFVESNQLEKAEELYTALSACHCFSPPHQLAVLHEQLGFIHHKKADSVSSLSHYKKSLRNYLTYLSPCDAGLLPVHLNIGILLKEQRNSQKAMRHFKHALTIALHSFSHDHLQISRLHHHLAQVHEASGNLVDTVQHYQSALENELRHFPLQHPSIAQTYNKIGETFFALADYSTALSYFEKTLRIQKKILSPNHASLANTNYNLARVTHALQQPREAIEYASRAVNIARHALASHDESVDLYVSYLAELRGTTLIGVIPNGAVYE